MTLIVENISSGYRRLPVIKDISFQIKEGEIVGLIGLNGAGKSTLLKTILGLLLPYNGDITVCSEKLSEDMQAYASKLAYVPETPILYDELTLAEHIEMTALGYQIPIEIAMERAKPLLKIFRLDDHLSWFPTHFSKGMKQKVMIVCALITDAKLFIIDEPFLGLDPLAIRQFTDLLRERAEKGSAILFTTHVLSIAEKLCDQYLLLDKGQIVGQGNLEDLRTQFNDPTANLDDIYIQMTEGLNLVGRDGVNERIK
ncbi:ABC transporter ATP-binding protein [Facklamia sp. DSM 111018]|uniref:ABC transporter ATP-binding protein n=1 Tax=Facklamia lactis TaxID=2749967 RepID=A0ABS0LSC1_9LACT|nr:ABC transporter ATP-binding protein [Facklamia lactis]MBG9981458.1 ABC transporter ATP-binding protein [Facklamia lactis]MBG9987066.1 ABC transporter ATP-binding protein [Facklamia lactis]